MKKIRWMLFAGTVLLSCGVMAMGQITSSLNKTSESPVSGTTVGDGSHRPKRRER